MEAGLISASTTFDSEIKPLKVLLEFTAETAATIKKNITAFPVFSEGVTVDMPQLPSPHFTQLALLKEIRVYKNHWLKYKKCSLTLPMKSMNIQEVEVWPARLRFQYKNGASPGFHFSQY